MSVDRDTRYIQCGSTPLFALTGKRIDSLACVLQKGHDGPHQDREGRRRL